MIKRLAIAIVGSVLTSAYWWIVFTIVYADSLFAEDRNPALPPPPDDEAVMRSAVVIGLGVLLYALLSMLWLRLTRQSTRTDRR